MRQQRHQQPALTYMIQNNNSHMAFDRQSLVIPSALDKRESMAAPDFHNPHMDFPSLSEFYYLDSEPVCKDTTTSFCPWDFVNENLAFDIPPPNHINAESQIPALDAYPSLAEQNSRVLSNRASCTSLLPSVCVARTSLNEKLFSLIPYRI